MPTYDFMCDVCEHQFDSFLSIADRDTPQSCPECQQPASRLMTAPRVLRESYLDGARGRDPEWQRLKQTSKLKVAKAQTKDKAERARINSEIKRINTRGKPTD
jgi:putative FmdB family regulatory protein